MDAFIRDYGGRLVSTTEHDAHVAARQVRTTQLMAREFRTTNHLTQLELIRDGVLVNHPDTHHTTLVSLAFLSSEPIPRGVEGRLEGSRVRIASLPALEREWHCAMRAPRSAPITVHNVCQEMSLNWVDSLMPESRLRSRWQAMSVVNAAKTAKHVLPPGSARMQRRLVAPNRDCLLMIMSWLVDEHTPLAALSRYKLVNHLFYQIVWSLKIHYLAGALHLTAGNARHALQLFTWLAHPLGKPRMQSIAAAHRHLSAVTTTLKQTVLPRHRHLHHAQQEQQEQRSAWALPKEFAPLATLTRLELNALALDNAMVGALMALGPRFTVLTLRQCAVNEDALLTLLPSCSNLQALCVADNFDTLLSLERVAPLLSALTGLDISNDRLLQQASVNAVFAHCTSLRFLDMGGIINANRIVPPLSQLEVLYVDGCHVIGPGVVGYEFDLSGCPNLRALDLSQTSVAYRDGGALATLSQLTRLESLHLCACNNFEGVDITLFADHLPPALRYLNVSGIVYEDDATYQPLILALLKRPDATFVRCPMRVSDVRFLEHLRYILYPFAMPVSPRAAAHTSERLAAGIDTLLSRGRSAAAAVTVV